MINTIQNPPSHSRRNLVLLLILLVAVIVAGYFFWYKPKHPAMAAPQMPPAEVIVMTVEKKEVQIAVELPGRVEAYKISEIRPQVSGLIKDIKFEEGGFVKKGQQLYQIDPELYQSSYEKSDVNYKALETKRKRYKNLLDLDAVSKQEYEDIEVAVAVAKEELKRSRVNLDYSRVYAPISGFIGKSNFTEGTLVSANQSDVLTTITQLDPIFVDMVQPAEESIRLGNQREISVTLVTDDPEYKNKGTLKFSEVFADETTDSVRLRAVFSNKDQKLLPGMFVNAKLLLKPVKSITVPQRATNRQPDGALSVFIVDENNVAKTRVITVGEAVGDTWVVTSGLNEGDKVVYDGMMKIADGVKVKPVDLQPAENSQTNASDSNEKTQANKNN